MAIAKKTKNISAGVGGKKAPKAPMVDPKGAYTKVQERTLGKSIKNSGSKTKSK